MLLKRMNGVGQRCAAIRELVVVKRESMGICVAFVLQTELAELLLSTCDPPKSRIANHSQHGEESLRRSAASCPALVPHLPCYLVRIR
jgi:hypothetical protein